jgi:hypothetical protein
MYIFLKLCLEDVIFTDLTLLRVNYSVTNRHVVTGVLEEVGMNTGTELIPQNPMYFRWRKLQKVSQFK